jgi:hypothetical protein
MNRQAIIENIRAKRDEVRQLFTDAAHWNEHVRKPHEPKIDPDPDGTMREIERAYTATLEREDISFPTLPEAVEENARALAQPGAQDSPNTINDL